MNIFELEILEDELPKCTFYTVRKDGAPLSETEKFFEKYEKDEKYRKAARQLLSLLYDAIGMDHGAHDAFFNRYENEVTGLPVQGKVKVETMNYHFPRFPLRLYVLRLSRELIVIFGGGVKDGINNQSSSLHLKWVEACQYARRIDEALRDGEIAVDFKARRIRDVNGEDSCML